MRWGGDDELLIATGAEPRLWTLQVTVYVGEAREDFEMPVGLLDAHSTARVPLSLPTSLFTAPEATSYLAPVSVRATGVPVDGGSAVFARANNAFAAFHDGLAGPPTYCLPKEWPEHVPYGIVHPTDALRATMDRLSQRGITPDQRIPAPVRVTRPRAPDVEFTGKDVPEHVVLSEDDTVMLQQVRAMTDQIRAGEVQP